MSIQSVFYKKKAQKRVGRYNTKYKYSADYDLFYRMIVKYNLKGMATKKNEIFGKFGRGGISSKTSFMDYLYVKLLKSGWTMDKMYCWLSTIFILKYTKYLIDRINVFK